MLLSQKMYAAARGGVPNPSFMRKELAAKEKVH